MDRSIRLATALLVSTLAACGGKSVDGAEPGGSSSEGGTSNVAGAGGKVGSAGEVGKGGTGSAGTPSAGASQGGNGSVCDGLRDEQATFIGVDIINQTSKTLYLGQQTLTCEVAPLFTVTDLASAPLPSPSRCRTSCGGAGGCTAICLFPTAIALAPGGTWSTSWDGLYDLAVRRPRECVASQDEIGMPCQQSKQVQPGTFVFSATAGSRLDCEETSCDDGCQENGMGACSTQGALVAGDARTATTTVALDGSYGVYAHELPPPGDASPGAADPSRVQIVFEDRAP